MIALRAVWLGAWPGQHQPGSFIQPRLGELPAPDRSSPQSKQALTAWKDIRHLYLLSKKKMTSIPEYIG